MFYLFLVLAILLALSGRVLFALSVVLLGYALTAASATNAGAVFVPNPNIVKIIS